ncbi:FAD-binding protein [Jannaschia sp. Os4]|uniref:FAD-binding protein n=1 Tax=Jannaschia sp. Os4 TaxID=2807617 RepID=UPI00193A6DAA|nr:FAD-binding protein [Jannaschia sp. Os4]MBM2577431.1 FAD-binding protein [Jannaschia sp. Os4]
MRPESEDALAEIVRGANGLLAVRGGATRHVPGAGEPLTTAGIAGIERYEPGALTLVAKAGTPVAEIETALAGKGQRLAFEPMDHRRLLGTDGAPTIGGAVAMNVSGPRRVVAGACRDFLLGCRFVDGEGTVVVNGGRVMKNVTGYDLTRLMAGARGSLGVLTEVGFKVLPAPQASATLTLPVADAGAAVAAMSAALTSPFEVTGAAWDGTSVLLRQEGLPGSVDYRVGALSAHLAAHGAVAVERDPEAVAATWAEVRDVAAFHGGDDEVWRVHVRPSRAAEVVAAMPGRAVMDWGGGLVWLAVPPGTEVRGALPAGYATLVRGQGAALHPTAPEVATLEAGLRARFDPKGLFAA